MSHTSDYTLRTVWMPRDFASAFINSEWAWMAESERVHIETLMQASNVDIDNYAYCDESVEQTMESGDTLGIFCPFYFYAKKTSGFDAFEAFGSMPLVAC